MSITRTSIKNTESLRDKNVIVFKSPKNTKLDDLDIIAISEWIESKVDSSEMFKGLRAIAYLCNIVDGLEELFFEVAKTMPEKIRLTAVSKKALEDELSKSEIINPLQYIKVVQKILKETDTTNSFLTDIGEDDILHEEMEQLSKELKIISIKEYSELKRNSATTSSMRVHQKSMLEELVEQIASNGFKRVFLNLSGDVEEKIKRLSGIKK